MIALVGVGAAGARQPPPRQDLLPAVDALLRRQLGDHASGCSARAAAPRRSSTREMTKPAPDRQRAGRRDLRPRDRPSYLLNKGLAFRAMHSHGRALNAPAAARGRRRRGLRRARGRADLQRRQRLELRRRPLPRPAAARGGAGALRLRAGRRAGDRARVRAGGTPGASATGSTTPRPGWSRRARSPSPTWSRASPGSTSRSTSRSR